MGHQIVLENVVLDYPSLFTAREYKGKWRYQATVIFDKGGDMDTRVKEVIAAAKAANPGKKLKDQYMDGDVEQPGNVHYAGKAFLRLYKNQEQGAPVVMKMDNTPLTVLEAALIYRGCLGNVIADAYIPKSPNDDKICWGLTAVQHAGEGERITGENDVDPSALFKPLTTEAKKPSFL